MKVTEGMVMRGAKALHADWADELDCWDEDPLSTENGWLNAARVVLDAALGDDDI